MWNQFCLLSVQLPVMKGLQYEFPPFSSGALWNSIPALQEKKKKKIETILETSLCDLC